MQKPRSRRSSEPEISKDARRKSDQASPHFDQSLMVEDKEPAQATTPKVPAEGWVGSVRNFVWSLWNQSAENSDFSDGSQSEVNMSFYEERIRMARPLPPQPMESPEEENGRAGQRPRLSSLPAVLSNSTTPAAGTPRHTNPYLTESDFGIKLEIEDDVNQASLLMTQELISILHTGLPSRWRIASKWKLLYSTELHGFSLNTLFVRSRYFHGPVLAIIKDSDGGLFGAFATEPWHPHMGHFGTGECFLWKLEKDSTGFPLIRRYKSTGENNYFMLCETDFIAAGCGDGKFGLWLDGQLEFGNSHTVPTYGNDPLASRENFECITFELWGLCIDE